MDKIDVNVARNVQPYWIYHRLKFTPTGNPRQMFIEKVHQGFVYLLRDLFIKASGYCYNQSVIGQKPYYCEIFSNAAMKTRQLNPIPVVLTASPGMYGIGNFGIGVLYSPAPSPVDADIFSVNASCQQPTCVKKLNYFFVSGDAVRIEFTTEPNASFNSYLDCILDGYYIPEKDLSYWEGEPI